MHYIYITDSFGEYFINADKILMCERVDSYRTRIYLEGVKVVISMEFTEFMRKLSDELKKNS